MFLPLITYFINLLTILLSLCSYKIKDSKTRQKQLLYFLLTIPTLSTSMPNSNKKNSDLRISIQVTIFSILEFF